jgi:hypothetical protein
LINAIGLQLWNCTITPQNHLPMNSTLSFSLLALVTIFGTSVATGGTSEPVSTKSAASTEAAASDQPNWLTGENVSLGGILFPHFHFNSVYGGTTADELPEIGHHDPREDGWVIQGFEFGLSARVNDYFEAYGNYHLYYDNELDAWDDRFEEWFGKIKNIPGGFELRGGRYLNRLGYHNTVHIHGWDFVDTNLVNGRFLGDDGLYTIGAEVTWKAPFSWNSLLSVSVGVPPDTGGGEHHEEEDGEHEEPAFEAGGALFDDVFVVANWTNRFDHNDFHQFGAGVSGAWGENLWGKTSQIYGMHFEYQWRQNGYEPGGRYLRWRTEAMIRSFRAVSGPLPGEEEDGHGEEEDGHEEERARGATLDEFGIYSSVLYGLGNGFELGLRGEYVSGISRAGVDERFRVSPAVTWYLNDRRTVYLRAQYNYDHSNDFGDEHSVWAQVGINWGEAHVR